MASYRNKAPEGQHRRNCRKLKSDLRSVLSIFLAKPFWGIPTFTYGSNSIWNRKMMFSDLFIHCILKKLNKSYAFSLDKDSN